MEFPKEIQMIINEYAKPMTRPDWRKGCYFNRHPYYVSRYGIRNYKTAQYTFKDIVRFMRNKKSIVLILIYHGLNLIPT
jgi:hypothetical protein